LIILYRYTIFYALILLIYITLSPYFGQDGPIYPKDGIETSTCRGTWWRNLLYINNLFDAADGCMPVNDKTRFSISKIKSVLSRLHGFWQ
jgi:hypothetical protein